MGDPNPASPMLFGPIFRGVCYKFSGRVYCTYLIPSTQGLMELLEIPSVVHRGVRGF